MSARKLARSFLGWPALKALRRSTRFGELPLAGKFVPRGIGGIRAVLIAGRPMRSSCTPLRLVAYQKPITLPLAPRSTAEGTSRTIARVLTLGPKKLGASKLGVLPGPKPLGLVPRG